MSQRADSPLASFEDALPNKYRQLIKKISCLRCQGTGIVQPPRDYSKPPIFSLSQKEQFCDCSIGVYARQREERLEDEMAAAIPMASREILEAGLVLMPRHADMRLETLESIIGSAPFAKVLDFVRSDRLRNLIVYGPPSVGKTGIIVSIMRALQTRAVSEGWKMHFTKTDALFELLKRGFDDGSYQMTIDRVTHVHLLALDDIGTEQSTPWTRSKFFHILAERYDRLLPTLISTNLSLDALEVHFSNNPETGRPDMHGTRIMERLMHDGVALPLSGKSRRIGGA